MTPTQVPSLDLDMFTDQQLLDPYPAYAQLRAAGPAVRLSAHQVWAVSAYDHVREVLSDHDTFSSAPNPGMEPDRSDMPRGGVLGSDQPDHTRLRAIVSQQLSPRALRSLRTDIEDRARQYVADLVQRDTIDVVTDLARPFPLEIVADLIGLPPEGRENLLTLANAATNSFGPANRRTLDGLPRIAEIYSYIGTAMSRDSIAPGSWGAALYEAVDDGRISERDGIETLRTYVVAGFDTTIHTVGSALWLLATHPDAWQALRADPTLARPVMEETLRLETPPGFMARAATRDVDFHGVPLAQGDRVLAMLASANRDENHYPAPDTFDIHRNPTDHLAFGYGIHGCGGQGLARMEVTAILTALAEQVERIELSGEPQRLLNNTMRGFIHLPVNFVPAA